MEYPMTTLMTMEHAGGGGISVDEANHDRRWWILAVLGIVQLTVTAYTRAWVFCFSRS